MEKRPKIDLELTLTDQLGEWVGWITLFATWISAVYAFVVLPETIPTHFNMTGEPDGYGSKISLMLIPLISTVVFVGMTLINRKPEIFNYPVKITAENAAFQYRNATRMIRWLKFSIVLIFLIILVAMYSSALLGEAHFNKYLIPVIFALTFVPLIIYLVTSSRNKPKAHSDGKK